MGSAVVVVVMRGFLPPAPVPPPPPLLRPDARQAPEVVGHAPPLVARPAGQVEPLDRRRRHVRRAATAPIGPAASARTVRLSARPTWPRHAAARCPRRRRPRRGPPGSAAPPASIRRRSGCDRSADPPSGSRCRARSTMARAASASDGPDVRMIRRSGSFAASCTANSTKWSAGHRRKGLPALTWTTTSRCAGPMPASARRRSTAAAAAADSSIPTRWRTRSGAAGSAGRGGGAGPTGSRPNGAAAGRPGAPPRPCTSTTVP